MNYKRSKFGRNDPCPCGAKKTNNLPKKYKHCCLEFSTSKNKNLFKTYLKTLPEEMNSRELCLDLLFKILDELTEKKVIRDLAFIGKSLDVVDIFGAHEKLVQKYASKLMRDDLAKDDTTNGVFLLFNRYALRLVDELLRVQISDRSMLLDDDKISSNIVYNAKTLHVDEVENRLKSIEGIFLLANTLIPGIENEVLFQKADNDENTRIFLSRRSSHKPSAIGRSRIYRYSDFPSRLQKIDLDIELYLKSAFTLCSHIETQPVAEIDLSKSLNQVISFKDNLVKYISLLTGKIKCENLTAKSSLAKLYYTDQLCRQHPLLQIDNLYYCLQPGLLWAALAELPFYLLLDSYKPNKKEGDLLWQFYGLVFEQNWRDLGARVFGIDRCEDYKCQKKYPDLNLLQKEHRIGDLLVSLDQDAMVIFEFKGAIPDDSIKLGNKDKLLSKFIYLEDGAGISQLCTDATAYRRETSFNGPIYIVLISRGPLPLTSTFDYEVKKYLSTHVEYQSYLLNIQNQPVIWMDETCLELLFSGLRQGLPFKKTFQSLAGVSPSKVPTVIFEKTQHYNLNFSSIDLYREEIREHVDSCRTIFL